LLCAQYPKVAANKKRNTFFGEGTGSLMIFGGVFGLFSFQSFFFVGEVSVI